jgi:hypothetical protein
MYHQTDVNLKRNITFVDEVGNNEVEETIICQDCDSKEKTKQESFIERMIPLQLEYNLQMMKQKEIKMYSDEDMKFAYEQGARLALISQSPLALHKGEFPTPKEWFKQFKNE